MNRISRKILSAVLFLLLPCLLNAQKIEPGEYIQDKHLGQFAGTWQAVSGADTLTLVFEEHKKQKVPRADIYIDVMLGGFRYVEGGAVAYDHLDWTELRFTESMINGFTDKENPSQLNLTIVDLKRDRPLKATLRLNPGRPDRAVLRVTKGIGGLRVTPPNPKPKKDTVTLPVPSTWQMRKIE